MSLRGSVSGRPFPVVVALALTALGIGAMLAGSGALASQPGLSLRAQIVLGTLLLGFPALAALTFSPGTWPAVRGPGPVTARITLLSVLLGAALWVGSIGLLEVQSLVAPPPAAYLDAFRAIHRALAPAGPVDALASILVIAVLPGVCEELLVRGVLLPSLASGGGAARGAALPPGPVVFSSLLFAAMHFDPYRFLFTLAIGLVLGVVRLGTGSLWPPVVAHVGLNTLTFAVAPFVDDPSQPYAPSPALGLVCLLAGAAVAWPLLRALTAFSRFSRPHVDSPRAAS